MRIRFWHVRVGILLAVLLGVLLYAWRDVERRRTRRLWQRPVRVALVLVEHEPIPPDLVEALMRRVPALESHLNAEGRRYLATPLDAFEFHAVGPVRARRPAPLEAGAGTVDNLRLSWKLWRYAHAADDASGIDSDIYDVRVYLAAHAGHGRMRNVEGVGQDGGRIGVVRVELADTMIDLALVVAAHEVFHTLGATDRYDADGRTLVPDGLAEPDLRPLYPQRRVEIMDRNRPISPTEAVPPESLFEIAVGQRTAREIGWIAIAPP